MEVLAEADDRAACLPVVPLGREAFHGRIVYAVVGVVVGRRVRPDAVGHCLDDHGPALGRVRVVGFDAWGCRLQARGWGCTQGRTGLLATRLTPWLDYLGTDPAKV